MIYNLHRIFYDKYSLLIESRVSLGAIKIILALFFLFRRSRTADGLMNLLTRISFSKQIDYSEDRGTVWPRMCVRVGVCV